MRLLSINVTVDHEAHLCERNGEFLCFTHKHTGNIYIVYYNYVEMPTNIKYKKSGGVIEKYDTKYDKLDYITSKKNNIEKDNQCLCDGNIKELNNTCEYDAISRL